MRRFVLIALALMFGISSAIPDSSEDLLIRDLIADLSGSDDYLRKTARKLLVDKGSAAVPALLGLLKSERPELRLEATLALAQMGSHVESAVPGLLAALDDRGDSPEVRAAAEAGLVRRGAAVVPALTTWARDNPARRVRVAGILAEMGPQVREGMVVLLGYLHDADDGVRNRAAEGLAGFGAAAVKPLVRELDSADHRVRARAVQVLAGIGPDVEGVLPALVKSLGDDSELVRSEGERGLRRHAEQVTPLLIQEARSGSESENQAAVRALAALDPEHAEIQRALLRAVLSGPDGARAEAVKGLRKCSSAIVPDLVRKLRLKRPEVQIAVARILGGMGSAAEAARPDLQKALVDAPPEVRDAVEWALETIEAALGSRPPRSVAEAPREPPSILPPLVQALTSQHRDHRKNALAGIAGLGPEAKEAIPSIMRLLYDPDAGVRMLAIETLGRIGADAAEDAFERLARAPAEDRVRLFAVIQAVGEQAAMPMAWHLSDEDDDTRLAAMEALIWLGPRANQALPALLVSLQDPSGQIRRGAVESIGAMGAKAVSALPDLVDVLRDPEKRARREAAEALARILVGLRKDRERPRRERPGDPLSEAGAARLHRASLAALRWLAGHQERDGGWDTDGFLRHSEGPGDGVGDGELDVGVTALAVLALMDGGALDPVREAWRFRANALTALSFLTASQRDDGRVGSGQGREGGLTYCHMTAALALCEGFRLTGEPRLRTAAERALEYIEMARNPYMAWKYGVRPKHNDTSVSAWAILAMDAGQRAGLPVPAEAFEGMRFWLERVTEPESGRSGYAVRGEHPPRLPGLEDMFPRQKSEANTAEAILVRMLLGDDPGEDEMILKGADLCLNILPEWNEQSGSIDMYYWYFGTRALARMGGDPWQAWSPRIKEALLGHQLSSGPMAGSWDPIGAWGSAGGRVYSTAIGALTLEACARGEPVPRSRSRMPREARPALKALNELQKTCTGELLAAVTRALEMIETGR